MPRVEICIERSATGQVIAHAPNLWGCQLHACDLGTALRGIERRVRDYLEWRRDSGIKAHPGRGKWSFPVIEDIQTSESHFPSGDWAHFQWDLRPMTRTELDSALEVHAAVSDQIRALTLHLEPVVQDWKSPAIGISVTDELIQRRNWGKAFLQELGWSQSSTVSQKPLGEDESRAEMIASFVRGLTPGLLNRGFEIEYTSIPDSVTWTVRKFLRRLCETELDTVDTIRRIIRDYQSAPKSPSNQ